jgi:hypothetical protein
VIDANSTVPGVVEYLEPLLYELLDAHQDTMRLAAGLAEDANWAAHLDYLRDLQRVGRERMAMAAARAA